jgi:solute carrier family 25 protein 33/36
MAAKPRNDNERVPSWVHLLSGAVGGTAAGIVLCPLEVVKTRMQASTYRVPERTLAMRYNPMYNIVTLRVLKQIVEKEGVLSLWRGVGANLIGIAPARALYFTVYSKSKIFITKLNGDKETPLVHLLSASMAGFMSTTTFNPVWVVKTRLQLSQEQLRRPGPSSHSIPIGMVRCIKDIYQREGAGGFYRGMVASYVGE